MDGTYERPFVIWDGKVGRIDGYERAVVRGGEVVAYGSAAWTRTLGRKGCVMQRACDAIHAPTIEGVRSPGWEAPTVPA